ncbi:MAG: hypothetical protein ACT6FG_00110 [Methanosarcinaceae archaeon]
MIDGITDAAVNNPYTVFIPPGVYDETVTPKNYIDIVGAGRNATIIKTIGDAFDFDNITQKMDVSNLTAQAFSNVNYTGMRFNTNFTGEVNIHNCFVDNVQTTHGALYMENAAGIIKGYNSLFSGVESKCGVFGGEYDLFGCEISSEVVGQVWQSGIAGSVGRLFNCYIHREGTGHYDGVIAGYAGCSPILELYNTFIKIDTTGTGFGIYSDSGTPITRMYGGRIDGGMDVYQANSAEIYIYNVIYNKSIGNILGTNLQHGRTVIMAGNGTLVPDQGNLLNIYTDGASREIVPTGCFVPWTQYTIINSASAAENIVFDPSFTASGSHSGANNADTLTDASAGWEPDQLIGKTIYNSTDVSAGTITTNTSTTITAVLSAGTDSDWDTGDNYIILGNALNQTIAQNERGIFVFTGSEWFKIFVG